MSKRSDDENEELPIDKTTLIEYYRSSTKAKLEWLEEINDFVAKTSTERANKIRERLRQVSL